MQYSEQIQIRRATANDANALGRLLRAVGWWAHLGTEDPSETETRLNGLLQTAERQESHSIYVAEEDGKVLGYAAVHWLSYLFLRGPEGFVSELFVDPEGRGRGVGTKLLAAIQAEAEQRGCVRLSLLNGKVRESYQRGFYTKQGWEERDQMANFVLYLK